MDKFIVKKIGGFLMYNLGGIKLRYFLKTRIKLKPFYSNQSNRATNVKPIIIAMVDGRVAHGGLGDRLHGILSLYMLSIEMDMDFKINFQYPFDLADYFQPNIYNWIIQDKDISYHSDESYPFWVYSVYKKYGKTQLFENEYHHTLFKNIVNKNKYKQYHFYTNTQWAQGEIYKDHFHCLFKPTAPLLCAAEESVRMLGGDYVAMVFRFQQLLGDFKEGNSPDPLDEDARVKLIDKCLNKIQSIRENDFPDSKILITSDSGTFLDAAKQLDFVYTIPGKVVHLSYTPEKDFHLHLKSFVDLMVLSNAKKIFLLVTDNMFHSGFAKSASLINNKEYEEIFF